MGSHSTADEVKQKHIEKLGHALGSLYHELWNELAWLYMKWEDYVVLFGTKPTRIGLLNKSAPVFFKIVQDSLWEDVLLHIARLTDPPKSSGKKNRTIQCLPSLVDESIRVTVSEQISNAIEKASFCRDWRNRHIAHRDLNLAMDEHAESLKQASRAKVIESLESISKVLNVISEFYMKSIVVFDSIAGPGGALDLLYVLDAGIRADTDRRKRIEAGQYLPEDIKHRDV
jgi:hypothetical protein